MTDAAPTTPLMEQYEGVKAQYPGHLVLFRVGDFYETFGDDARLLSKELEIVLTARAPDSKGDRTPMAGVPHHAVDTYLGRLVRKGYKVAICDQVEDARFAKGLVRREVTRVVTPGTVVEDRILPGPDHNFLAAVAVPPDGPAAYAAVDVSTGDWYDARAASVGIDGLLTALAPFAPRELLLSPDIPAGARATLEEAARREFPRVRLETAPPPATEGLPATLRLSESDPVVGEVGRRLAAYVRSTQPRLLPFLEVVERGGIARRLVLDGKTLRHLEIAHPMNPDDPTGATLIGLWDETATAPGRRTLAFWLRNPLADLEAIHARQDAVEALVDRGAELLVLHRELALVADLARICGRLAGRRLRPPELSAVRSSLAAASRVRVWLQGSSHPDLRELTDRLDPLATLHALLSVALPDALPATAEVGGLFRPGYAPDVDRLTAAEQSGLTELEALERSEQEASGIRTLKVGYNQVFGYYFDVSRPNLGRVPPHFRRKQTLAGGERFTSDRLAEIEARILSAREELGRCEAERWERFLGELEQQIPPLHRLSRAIGELDALQTFARIAIDRHHVRPLIDESRLLQIRDGRHPVLERTLGGRFVPNDTDLDGAGARLIVLTGPNMSGKSTYMRQVGLIVVLAQAGAWVPAKFVRLGRVTALFTRMGFTDEIGRGKSSFMVEMSEVAEIVRSADDRSLVLLDEVGRGTSTFDGLALAWATLKHLHDRVQCRSLLATHYHQLTELVGTLPGAANAHMAVRETGDEVVFLHRLVPGSTDRSYGLHVAKLAGLPPELLTDADRLLKRLEEGGVALPPARGRRVGARYTQGVLLTEESAAPTAPSELEEALRGIDLDRMTPIEALRWLHERRDRLPPKGGPGG